ncbi:NifU family protein [Desertimonas flava]|uniref:NifU family protein n=1 Tax=Desertimonas flava TaxID=2064846 RepID=UPI0013C446E4|nr:NifU family protein [Desertimonas flava]
MSPLEDLAGATSLGTSEPIIDITDAALAKLVELRNEEPDADQLGLRLEIASAPGEDFRYELGFEEFVSAPLTDEVRTHGAGERSIKVMVPAKDLDQLRGATLDFTESQGLVIRNPNRPAAPTIEGLITDDELSAEIEAVLAAEVNPALSSHGGFVTYMGHDSDGTAFMTMGGGCHGCSMSRMTMLDGVQTMLVEAVPGVTAVKDLTDHTTGANPYYQ